MNDPIRVAVLGCGTITRSEHLPAIMRNPQARLVALIDANEDRAAKLIRTYSLKCRACSDYRTILGEVDAVINALPNHLHAPVTLELIAAGVHVLCEKPLAIRSEDARACAAAAEGKKIVLAVGMNRRFQDNHQLLRAVLDEGTLGLLKGYDWQMGGPFDWNSASGFYFSKEQAGGGVLLDYGVHLLDSLISWFGPVTGIKYEDDDWGSGIESNARLSLQHNGSYGPITGTVRLSRTYPLSNRLLVQGMNAQAELPIDAPDAVILHHQLQDRKVTDRLEFADSGKPGSSSFDRQLNNFVRSIQQLETPRVGAREAAYVLELIEGCYSHRERLPEPWSDVGAMAGDLA